MSALQEFLHKQLQASLEFDDDIENNFKGGLVVGWVVCVEVLPQPGQGHDDGTMLIALAAEGQRSWTTKGMLVDAMDMERSGGL